jgi:hypothetical protein
MYLGSRDAAVADRIESFARLMGTALSRVP